MLIKDVKAREIMDSRGNPTVEVDVILDFLNIEYEYEGYGYLESQSIEPNTIVNDGEKVKLVFKPKY